MTRLAPFIILVMIAVTITMAGTVHTASAAHSNPDSSVTALSHTLCDYVSDGTRPLRVWGSRGNAVKQIQCLINIYSFAPGTLKVDGIFGRYTYNAVIWVQRCARSHGLPGTYVDGKVGPQTWNILYNQPRGCGTRPIGNPH